MTSGNSELSFSLSHGETENPGSDINLFENMEVRKCTTQSLKNNEEYNLG